MSLIRSNSPLPERRAVERRDNVRFVGSASFRDSSDRNAYREMTVEEWDRAAHSIHTNHVTGCVYCRPVSPAVARFREAAANGIGLSSDAARARRGRQR